MKIGTKILRGEWRIEHAMRVSEGVGRLVTPVRMDYGWPTSRLKD